MDYSQWYTDTVDVFRVVQTKEGNLTRQKREQVISKVPCRIYRADDRVPTMRTDAADVKQTQKIALDNSVDIRAGDELHITRGGTLGHDEEALRAFAGTPHKFYEPFGAVIPGLAHQEIVLLEEERVK